MRTKNNAAEAAEASAAFVAASAAETGESVAAAVPGRALGKRGDRMYLGPTITGVVRHGTVFKDGVLPKRATECIAELPVMERLFVETDRMPEAVTELGKKQSALGAVYAQVAEHFNAAHPGGQNTGRI
ncbi:MAG: hypothetical protein K2N94_14050 [Lachnospiraceae bacterium]|nr:hypothetical protein [Lachnospiraceae bacterium]